jgi:hypothetical protein
MELGGRININISNVQITSYGGAKFLLLIQDDFTGYLWRYVVKAVSDLPKTIYDWLKLVQEENSLSLKNFRLDHSGENK